MRQLTHPDPSVRREAIATLAELGPAAEPAIEALQSRLRDRDLSVRIEAARASACLGVPPEKVIPVLCDLLLSENPQVCGLAGSALGELGPAAQQALPSLEKRLASPSGFVRQHCASAILQIEANHSDALSELLAGVSDEAASLRCFAINALGALAIDCDEVIVALQQAQTDSDMNVAAAARTTSSALEDGKRPVPEAAEPAHGRPTHTRVERIAGRMEPVALPASSVTRQVIITAPVAAAREAAREARLAAQAASRAAAEVRALAVARADMPKPQEVAFAQAGGNDQPMADYDPDEGLRPIGSLGASIRMSEGEMPADRAAARFATVPAYYHGYGARRGWHVSAFGWDAPAVFFKPLYFEDINLERYGIHYGCLQPVISFGHFFTRCISLPYKLLVQPPCECIYTLGYERPNNCIPMYCYCKLGYPSYARWCQQWTCPCPVRQECPWLPSEDGVCTNDDDCP